MRRPFQQHRGSLKLLMPDTIVAQRAVGERLFVHVSNRMNPQVPYETLVCLIDY